ncbi:MAG TPA: CDP-glucose 4,6-dehydratase [Cytophaga sp.]|nr:CDP-glucose 4,6-dehydratase [Cytophaga sp.]
METMEIVELFKKAYAGKKIFITGHTGFKGAWLSYVLHMLGAEIKGYALAPEHANNLYNLLQLDKTVNSVIADLRDEERLKKEILDFKPDYVFHLAAQPLVRLSYDIPVETFSVNAIGTANVLQSIRFLNGKCNVICITTDKVYENKEWLYPYRESDRLGGYDPYSASKACTEIVISSFRQSFFNPAVYKKHQKSIASARAGNVIGGGDWSKDRIIPDIVRALQKNEPIPVRNPLSIRPWQHVLEPLTGYLLLGHYLNEEPEKYSEAYNFGPQLEDTLTVEALVKLAIQEWGSGSIEYPKQENVPHEAGFLKLDINKSISTLGWKPRWNAETAISKTIQWYKEPLEIVRQITESQIKDYLTWNA